MVRPPNIAIALHGADGPSYQALVEVALSCGAIIGSDTVEGDMSMKPSRVRWSSLASLAVLAAACGGPISSEPAPPDAAPAPSAGTSSPSAPPPSTAPKTRPKVIGSPVRISIPDNFEGRPFDEVKAELEPQIREQCGDGTLCISVVAQVDDDPSNDDNVNCDGLVFPKPSGEVPREGTLVLLINHKCEAPGLSSSATQEPTEEPTGDG